MRSSTLATVAAAATGTMAPPRFAMYLDQWHTASLPNRTVTAGVTHAITAFAGTTVFTEGGSYTPFMPLNEVRALFDRGTKVCMAIGGWGDTAGFSAGAATDKSRKQFAKNVADTIHTLGYDCVDVDWEYPGGDGQDWRQIPNSQKVGEIKTYALLLEEIKAAIGGKELSIAVPGRQEDMIAFTAEQVPKIDKAVDYINVMAYDLMTRRMNETTHHSSVEGSLETVNTYLQRGMTPSKMNLGMAYYAKWFTTKAGIACTAPTGCPTATLEAPNGTDTGLSGAITFESSSWGGALVHAMQHGKEDTKAGGMWYWDPSASIYWTWDTPQLITRKFHEIVAAKGLGGVMAWSLALDSHDWTHVLAMQAGIKKLKEWRAQC